MTSERSKKGGVTLFLFTTINQITVVTIFIQNINTSVNFSDKIYSPYLLDINPCTIIV